jgi:hypothetical protein
MWNLAAVPAVKVTEFWMLVDRRGRDDCWPFTGYINEDGYGAFYIDGRMVGAHELALTFTTGERRLPHLDTCHSCTGSRSCCNPRHLRFDTRQSNVDDTVRAGRNHRRPGLSDGNILVIRLRREAGAAQQDLAAQFNVSDGYISLLVRGLTRPDLGGPIQTKRGAYQRRNIERTTKP